MSRRYGVRDVRHGPGSDDARVLSTRWWSAQALTVSCGGGRSIKAARRRTWSVVRGTISNPGRVEAIGRLREQIGDVLLQHSLNQMRVGAEVSGD